MGSHQNILLEMILKKEKNTCNSCSMNAIAAASPLLLLLLLLLLFPGTGPDSFARSGIAELEACGVSLPQVSVSLRRRGHSGATGRRGKGITIVAEKVLA